ncbi:hypothetical protein ACRRTK_012763 [Alexandromys fortis]
MSPLQQSLPEPWLKAADPPPSAHSPLCILQTICPLDYWQGPFLVPNPGSFSCTHIASQRTFSPF